MQNISFRNFNLGGLSDSLVQGGENTFYELVGCDIHSSPGILKANYALELISGILVDDFVRCILPCSDGRIYFFGSTNGKIWSYNPETGSIGLEATAAPAAGSAGILDAKEYDGRIYYAMEERVGRVSVGAPTDWSGRNDSYATFNNGSDEDHPMKIVNQVLYIGDQNEIAQVNGGIFTASALDFEEPNIVKALGRYSTDLIAGSRIDEKLMEAFVFRWTTWEDSFSVSDDVPEVGVNSFLASDNLILVSVGDKGNIYSYDGYSLESIKRIPGEWDITQKSTMYANATTNLYGLPLFGTSKPIDLANFSQNNASPIKNGVYSLGRYDANYPRVLNFEYVVSCGDTDNIKIGALARYDGIPYVSWQRSIPAVGTSGNPTVINIPNHGLSHGSPLMFETQGGTLLTGLTDNVIYYARVLTEDTVQLFDTAAHAIGGVTGQIVTSESFSGSNITITWGVDALSDQRVQEAYVTTTLISGDRDHEKTVFLTAGYLELPNDADIKFHYKTNGDSDFVLLESEDDTDRKIKKAQVVIPPSTTILVRVSLECDGNQTPEVDSIDISFN